MKVWVSADPEIPHHRLDYVLEVWTDASGIQWRRHRPSDPPPILHFGYADRGTPFFLRADPGWKHRFPFHPSTKIFEGMPIIFGHDDGRSVLPFDPFAATFWLLTEWEKYDPNFPRDVYGRYDERKSWVICQRVERRPIIHYWIQRLTVALQIQWTPPHRLRIRPTIDVDMPWGFQHRPLWQRLGKALRVGRLHPALWLLGRSDPYDVRHWNHSLPPSTLFLMLDGGEDHPWSFEFPPYAEMIRQIRRTGFKIGLHGSLRSGQHPSRWLKEKERLERVAGTGILSNRQHFLRYSLPESYQVMAAAGIRKEYTTCGSGYVGFKHGIAVPFRWYNPIDDCPTNLRLVPTLWMDRALMRITTPSRVPALVNELMSEARRWNGSVAVLCHNALWAGMGEWRPWKKVLLPFFMEQM